MNDDGKLLFVHAQSPPLAPLRIPRAVAIFATARSHQRLHPLHSDRIHPVFEIRGNSRLRARHPLSECINFSSFVLDAPCDTAAATNAITRRVSLCFTTRRLGVYLNGLINRPEFNIELREVVERGLLPYSSVSQSHKDRRPRQSLRICLFPTQSPLVPRLATFAQ